MIKGKKLCRSRNNPLMVPASIFTLISYVSPRACSKPFRDSGIELISDNEETD